MCAAKMAGLPSGVHGKGPQSCGPKTAEEAANLFSVSKRSVETAMAVLRDGCKPLILSDTPYSLAITEAVFGWWSF